MKKELLMIFLIVFASPLVYKSFHHYDDELYVNVFNDGDKDLDDLKIRLFFLDEGRMYSSSNFDLDEYDHAVARFILNGEKGLLKVETSNDDYANSWFIWI